MKTYKLKKGSITLYQSTKEMPADLYSDLQKYLMLDAGVGCDMRSVNHHLQKWDLYASRNELAEARQERFNLQTNFFHIINNINTENFSFACLIQAIDEKPLLDYSEQNLKQVISDLSKRGLTYGLVSDTIEEVKKNLIPN